MDPTTLASKGDQARESSRDVSKLSDYRIISKLGQGTFGVVQKATRIRQGLTFVALKQLINHSAKEGFPITALREITILKQLHHINILPILDIVYADPKISTPAEAVSTRGCFYTSSPYMSSDLVGLLENPTVKLLLPHIKCLMRQLLTGIDYIHSQRFLHRDIKAANILVGNDGILKIADFGLARKYHGPVPQNMLGSALPGVPGGGIRSYTGLVVTRWYRAPEILLGERKYTTAVDVWGAGCVFAELFVKKPILPGKLDVHQAHLVFELLGLPNAWASASKLPNSQEYLIGLTCKRTLEQRFAPIMPPTGVDLLSGLLALDPMRRLTAADAIAHEFFSTEPLPVEPGELPKFEESHEIDKERYKQLKDEINNQTPKLIAPVAIPTGPKGARATPSAPSARSHRLIPRVTSSTSLKGTVPTGPSSSRSTPNRSRATSEPPTSKMLTPAKATMSVSEPVESPRAHKRTMSSSHLSYKRQDKRW